ncbi:MAG: hypothetical protein NC111_02695 [Bacteroides sp.]|nr:hypothetical protein [Bacteroides sp.]MCM1413264.1 hypothetical protein [Bacteroides sp.]MCM1471426.1 hypothetical protein [Bacteroides sp.]
MEKKENTIDTRRFWRTIKQFKWVFLAIIVLFTALGIWKAVRSLPKYEIEGQMLIGEIGYDSDNRGGGLAQMMKTFSVGGFSASTVDNEVLIMQSHDVMLRTVRTLGLNRTYIGKDSKGKKAQLYKNTPVRLEAPVEQFDSLGESFGVRINLLDNGKVDITAFKGLFKKTIAEMKGAVLPAMLKTPYGDYQIMATDEFKSSPYREVTIAVTGNDAAATMLYRESTIDVASKMADIINVDYACANAELGKVTVDGIMTEYNAKRLDRLHEAAVASIKYYDERVAETFKILQQAEKEVSDYQRENELMGIDSELELLVQNSVGSRREIENANYNIAYYETVLNILRNRLDDDVIIPQMESLNDPNINAFNGAIQARRELRRSATDDNEALKLMNEKIEELRNLIIENSTKMIAKAKADVQHQQSLANNAQGRLDQYPDYQLEFMNLMRDKEYQNQLYQFLVSQRESSVLQLYSTTNIGFVFQNAYVVKAGGILKKLIWPAVLFVFALCVVIAIAIAFTLLSRKVKQPMDVGFIDIDGHTINYDGDAPEMNRMRTLIMSDNKVNTIYFASLGGNGNSINVLANSFAETGRSVEIISGLANNAEVLSVDLASRVKEMLTAGVDYVMVEVPDPEHVSDIENLVDHENSALVVNLPYNRIKRAKLKKILKGQSCQKVYAIIAK